MGNVWKDMFRDNTTMKMSKMEWNQTEIMRLKQYLSEILYFWSLNEEKFKLPSRINRN